MSESAEPSPLWCRNNEPHPPHSARNEFNGINYCTGRTDITLGITRLIEERHWEYAVRDSRGRVWHTATAGARPGDTSVRRRKAGEWEEV